MKKVVKYIVIFCVVIMFSMLRKLDFSSMIGSDRARVEITNVSTPGEGVPMSWLSSMDSYHDYIARIGDKPAETALVSKWHRYGQVASRELSSGPAFVRVFNGSTSIGTQAVYAANIGINAAYYGLPMYAAFQGMDEEQLKALQLPFYGALPKYARDVIDSAVAYTPGFVPLTGAMYGIQRYNKYNERKQLEDVYGVNPGTAKALQDKINNPNDPNNYRSLYTDKSTLTPEQIKADDAIRERTAIRLGGEYRP